jgi:hypothetical protein
MRTLGGVSNIACRSLIRLFEPLTRNVPATSVAVLRDKQCPVHDIHGYAPFSFKYSPLATEDLSMLEIHDIKKARAPFGNDDRNVTPYVKLSIGVCS